MPLFTTVWFTIATAIPAALVGSTRHLRTHLGRVPGRPKICFVGSDHSRVLCVNGSGYLHGQIQSCFHSVCNRTPHVAAVIVRVISVRVVIASARSRTLTLRTGLVGRRRPRFGILLGSSGGCPCLYIA